MQCMYIYMPHMKSLPSTIQQEALYTYLTYITEQIWLPYSNHISLYQHVRAYGPNIFAYITQT